MKNLIAVKTTIIDFGAEAKKAGVPGSESSFGGFFGGIMKGVMSIAAILVMLYLVWGAVEWITSGGDKGKVESAKNKITQAIIGLLVLSVTTGVFMLLQEFLGICVLRFGGSC